MKIILYNKCIQKNCQSILTAIFNITKNVYIIFLYSFNCFSQWWCSDVLYCATCLLRPSLKNTLLLIIFRRVISQGRYFLDHAVYVYTRIYIASMFLSSLHALMHSTCYPMIVMVRAAEHEYCFVKIKPQIITMHGNCDPLILMTRAGLMTIRSGWRVKLWVNLKAWCQW